MSIPTYKQWTEGTSLNIIQPRNSALKAVDDAILQYESSRTEKNLWRIKSAFDAWKRATGPMWETSSRNRTRAVTRLNFELQHVADSQTWRINHLSMQEFQALAYISAERKKALGKVFTGKQVTLKAAQLKAAVQAAAQKVIDGSKGVKAPSPPTGLATRMEDMAKSFFCVDRLEQLGSLAGLVTEILKQFAVSVPPVVGHIKDGYDLFTGWAKVGADLYARHNISERVYTIDTGVPSRAFDALRACLKAETENEAITATTATTSFALKTGRVFVDGGAVSGPVVGVVTALTHFAHQLYLLAVEWRATKAINAALQAERMDIRLFQTYPLMGCYMLVSATLSDLIPIDCFATPGWMDTVENVQQHGFSRIYQAAAELIEKSPWEIEGLPKRPKGSSVGIVAEAKRLLAFA